MKYVGRYAGTSLSKPYDSSLYFENESTTRKESRAAEKILWDHQLSLAKGVASAQFFLPSLDE